MVGVRPGTRDGLRKHVVRSHLLAPLGLVISPIARLGEVHGRSGCRDGPGGGRPAFIHSANEAGTREGAHVGSTWADMGCVQGAHICSALGSKGHSRPRRSPGHVRMRKKPASRSSAGMVHTPLELHVAGAGSAHQIKPPPFAVGAAIVANALRFSSNYPYAPGV